MPMQPRRHARNTTPLWVHAWYAATLIGGVLALVTGNQGVLILESGFGAISLWWAFRCSQRAHDWSALTDAHRTCSECGHVKSGRMTRSDRLARGMYRCDNCLTELDARANYVANLEAVAGSVARSLLGANGAQAVPSAASGIVGGWSA